MFTIRGRWGDGRDRHADGFQHSRGVASMGSDILAHFSYDDHGFSDLKSFRFAPELVWGVRRRGCGVILRGGGTFPDAVS